MSRYHLALEALRRARKVPPSGESLATHCNAMLKRTRATWSTTSRTCPRSGTGAGRVRELRRRHGSCRGARRRLSELRVLVREGCRVPRRWRRGDASGRGEHRRDRGNEGDLVRRARRPRAADRCSRRTRRGRPSVRARRAVPLRAGLPRRRRAGRASSRGAVRSAAPAGRVGWRRRGGRRAARRAPGCVLRHGLPPDDARGRVAPPTPACARRRRGPQVRLPRAVVRVRGGLAGRRPARSWRCSRTSATGRA